MFMVGFVFYFYYLSLKIKFELNKIFFIKCLICFEVDVLFDIYVEINCKCINKIGR